MVRKEITDYHQRKTRRANSAILVEQTSASILVREENNDTTKPSEHPHSNSNWKPKLAIATKNLLKGGTQN